MAQGEMEQAQKVLEMLAGGITLEAAGMEIYSCDPLQVSALTLSAAGCGRDAAFGTARYAAGDSGPGLGGSAAEIEQQRWRAAYAIIEKVRVGKAAEIPVRYWDDLGFCDGPMRDSLISEARKIVRNGHGWGWLVG